MELSDIRLALRRYWPVAIMAMAFWLAIGVMIGVLPQDVYRTSSTILATPSVTSASAGPQVANFEIPNIVARINSRTFREGIREDVPSRLHIGHTEVWAEAKAGTGIIRVFAEGPSPSAVAAFATAGAERAVETAASPSVDLEMLDPASQPGTPISPKPLSSLVATTIAGLITAVLATVVFQRTRRALDLETEIKRRLGLPVIGQIPAVRHLRRSSPMVDVVLAENAAFAEAIQALRTNVEVAVLDARRDDRVVAMASWGMGEGKSTVAAALGGSIAAGGREVVIIDADLRRPTQHLKLGEPFGEGLSEAGRVDPARLLRRTRQDGLYFLSAGTPDRHPADVVAANLPNTLHLLARDRMVVIDAPPIHGIAETPLILSLAQRIILVVDSSSTKLPEIERAVNELRDSGVTIIGVVLNRMNRRKAAAGYGAYVAATPVATAPRRPPLTTGESNGGPNASETPVAPGSRTGNH